MVDGSRGNHEARVDRSTDDTTQGVPGTVIEPVVKGVEAFFGQELRRAIVEVRIELMDDGFVSQNREQARCKCQDTGKGQDEQFQECLLLVIRELLRQEMLEGKGSHERIHI